MNLAYQILNKKLSLIFAMNLLIIVIIKSVINESIYLHNLGCLQRSQFILLNFKSNVRSFTSIIYIKNDDYLQKRN